MKKFLSLLLIVCFVLSLVACANTTPTTSREETKVTNEPTVEESIIKTVTDEQLAEWRALTDRRIAEIESTSNMEIPAGAIVYYVSNNGSDSNDGLTPKTAWNSLTNVNKVKFKEGTYVLFERGGLWRGTVTPQNGVTYSAYGEGEKPKLYASLFNGADSELWTETEVPNVWKIRIGRNDNVIDVGFVICDEQLGAKAILSNNYDGTPVDYVSGYPFASYADLRKDMQFFYQVESKNTGYVYMYSEGNPGERFESIEFGITKNIMFAETLKNVTVDNIAFGYCGAHGFGIGGSTNITVQNCTFKWIGGGIPADTTDHKGRYGNGIEIYGPCDGFYVKNNYLYQIYDTGITCQYNGQGDEACYMLNQEFLNNVVEYCNSPFEEFNNASNNEKDPTYESRIENYLIAGNITWHSGDEGLCIQRPHWNGSNIASGNATRAKNFVIKDNLFIYAEKEILGPVTKFENTDGSESLPILINNTFVHYKNREFARLVHDWTIKQSYDDSIPEALAEGSYGNQFYAFPNSEPATATEPNYEVVKFGKYEQDNNLENGTEDIEWYIVDHDGEYALLVSKYILDSARVSSSRTSNKVWEQSLVREWLNSSFIDSAFNIEELAKIRTTHVVMDENPDYPSDSGNDTDDKVFLLSLSEVLQYFPTDDVRICKATKYAHEVGILTVMSSTFATEYATRTIGIKQDRCAFVSFYGEINTRGDIYDLNQKTVRPAMWVKLGD